MTNFEWNFPTKLIYGPGQLNELGNIVKTYGKKVFLATYESDDVFGPLIERVSQILQAQNMEVVIFSEIEPNPRVKTIDKGIQLFNEEKCDVLVALGGGSVIDGSKYIAATAFSGGSCWDYVVLGQRKPREYTGAYPIISIPTVSASGSEVNAGGVLTNWETNEKSFSRSEYRIPKVAILDPELLTSLPLSVTRDSCIDIFSHLIERYLSSEDLSEFADRITEGIFHTLRTNFYKVLENPKDLEVRGQIALCSIFGWQGIQALGRMGTIPMHSIEMPLSGYYDLSHGRGMAVVIPPYLEYFDDKLPHRWAKLARRLFDVQETDDLVAAKLLTEKTIEWFKSVDMYLKLSDIGIDNKLYDKMADDVIRLFGDPKTKKLNSIISTTKEDIVKIYELC